jgi:peptidoglycan/LPS O-acetylase OafA/YrhL
LTELELGPVQGLVPVAETPQVRGGYNPSLDGLRALAVLAVCAYHMSILSTGYIGVDLFLVLSGFLITSLMLAERARTGAISIPAFYVRRAYRLLPAFYVFLIVGAVLVLALRGGERRLVFLSDALSALLYYANYWRVFHQATESSWLGHVWSLSLEEQFYVVWPVCLAWLCRRPRLRAELPRILLLAALGVMLWRNVLIAGGVTPARLYFGLDTRADALLLGCALGAFKHNGYQLRGGATPSAADRWLSMSAVKLGPFALLCLALITTGNADPDHSFSWLDRGGYTLVALLAGVVILSVDGPHANWWTQSLGSRPLSGLGRISYGFYLWHYPVTAIGSHLAARIGLGAAYVTTVAISAALAALSFRWIERPAQLRRPPWAASQ